MKEHQCHCCPPPQPSIPESVFRLNRRSFLAGTAAAGSVLGGLSWNSILMGAASQQVPMPAERVPLVVKPVLMYDLPQRRELWSWRGWGGVQTPDAANEEAARITKELAGIKESADFPVEFLEVTTVHHMGSVADHPDVAKADLLIVYGAGGGIDPLKNIDKDAIVFQRWKSGPVYLQYEIVSPRFLRQHTDRQQVLHIQPDDVVTDSLDELAWRLRALCGLKNAKNAKIVTIGGAGAWAQPAGVVPEMVQNVWGTQYHDISYPELGELLKAAKADAATMKLAVDRAEAYMKLPNTWMKEAPPWGTASNMEFVVNCFVLDKVFRQIMAEAGCRNLTINSCMGTIMDVARTAACLTLTTLNDDGYLAFCESDFVVIPAGILMGNITGKPVFLCNPCYPHDQILTFAHCTGPRKMDGKKLEPTYIVTHYESDYGAAPKVEYPNGTIFTAISTDFESKNWFGLRAEVVEAPFRPICTTQIDVKYNCPSAELAARMHGFHWMLGYGDYRKEVGYALRRVGISWDSVD
ncbi:MAG: twin-arginine translocation signal domain-containing protein [Planctomycetaceae bacterium]|nr:twin-arginine translocation signal domain-containing protein [Planctomycetaceae bacterium]